MDLATVERRAGLTTYRSSPLVGRGADLAMLTRALESSPATVALEGDAGIGKTRLLHEWQAGQAPDRRVLVGWCQRIQEPFPLAPVVEAVRTVGPDLAEVGLSPVTGALRPLLPELAEVLPPRPEPLSDRGAERHRVYRGLVEVLAAAGQPVLMLEDMHWVDAQTIEFVSYLFQVRHPQLSLVLTYRSEETPSRVRALTARMPASARFVHIKLAPLDAHATGELAAALLDQARVSPELAAHLCRRTAGLPFAIEELVALLRTQDAPVHRGGDRARQAIEQLAVPAGMRDPILERFSTLNRPAQSVTEAAAALQVPSPAAIMLATCGNRSSHTRAGLDQALQSGLLVELTGPAETGPGGLVGFRHPLAAQAVYESIPLSRRQLLHSRAAAALANRSPAALGQRAFHLGRAGRLAAWVEVAEQAADRASSLGHDDEAVRLLEEVLRHGAAAGQRRGRLAVKLSRAAVQATQLSEDLPNLLSTVPAEDLPAPLRGELRLWLALLLVRSGQGIRAQRPLFAAAVPDLRHRPELQCHAMVALGLPVVPGLELAEYRRWLDRAWGLVPRIVDPATQAFLLGKVAMILTSIGDPHWRRVAQQVMDRTGRQPRLRPEVNAHNSVGLEACYIGDLEVAGQLLTSGLAGALACESEQLELRIRAALAMWDYCRGAWDGLASRVDTLIDRLADHAHSRADLEAVAGCLMLAHGQPMAARAQLVEVMREIEQRGTYDLLPIPATAVLRMLNQCGETGSARRSAAQLVTVIESVPLVASAARALPAVVEALAASGHPGEATELLQRWQRQLCELDAPLAGPAVPHARGVLLRANGDRRQACMELLAAASGYDSLTCPYDAAHVREQAAATLFADGDQAAGASHLRAAMGVYQRLHASGDLDRAASIARRHGVSVPTRHRGGSRGYGQQLSPREQEVAALAARGCTNPEIADQLSVSIGTIKKQLAGAMRKLGVSSRIALAHLPRPVGAGQGD